MADLVMFRKTSLTGGGATAVDGISATALVGNELCFTTVSDVGYLYRMNATSGAAADGVNIIIPVVGTVGDKRWILEGVKFTSAVATALAALTTPAESWIGPSSTTGVYFKSGNVGIGTTSLVFGLTVVSDNGNGYVSGFRSSASYPLLAVQTTGSITGLQALNAGLTDVANMFLQISGGYVGIGTTDLDGTPAVGKLTVKGTTTDGSTLIFAGRDSDEANVITVDTDGDILNSAGVYGTISDAKLKENIIDTPSKLTDILKVKVRNFNLVGETNKQIGMVAQELETVFPGLVKEIPDYESIPDPDWVPKTLERQVIEKVEVTKTKEEIVKQDGKYIKKIITEVVIEDRPVFDNVPLYDESGKASEVHRIPKMESYTEDESARPKILRATGTVTKAVKTSLFIPILIKAVQELEKRVENLEKEKVK